MRFPSSIQRDTAHPTSLSIVLGALMLIVPAAALAPLVLGQGPTGEVQVVPEVVDGFTLETLAPASAPTAITFGPGGTDGADLYAATLAGNVVRHELAWTPLGPVVEDASVVASGFNLPLGLAFDEAGDLYVSDSETSADAGRLVGFVVKIDANTGQRERIVDGVPNGQHNINHLQFGPDGQLYLPVGNPNDHGNGTGTGDSDIFPYSGAFLRVDVDELDAQGPAVLHWVDANGDRIPDDDIVDHPRNQDFADKVDVFARGFRNIFDLAFAPDTLPFAGTAYTGENGADAPSSQDSVYKIEEGGNHGYPFCYNVGEPGATGADVSKAPNPNSPNPDVGCNNKVTATALIGWHICATGVDFPSDGQDGPTAQGAPGIPYTFPSGFQQSLFVAECGPFFLHDTITRTLEQGATTHNNGHKVTRVALDANGEATDVEDFVKGLALPTDVKFGPDGAMYIADAGALYRVAPIPSLDTPDATVPVAAAGVSFIAPVTVVPTGTTVEWTRGALPHSVTTSEDPCIPHLDSSTCQPNDVDNSDANPDTFNHDIGAPLSSVSHTFENAGTFPYYCSYHYQLGMVGMVVVLDPANPAASASILEEARELMADSILDDPAEADLDHTHEGHVHA